MTIITSRLLKGALMDQYYVLTKVLDRRLANIICTVLEDEQIPVMVEHLPTAENGEGFQILVPARSIAAATRLAKVVSESYSPGGDSRKEWS